MDPLFNSFRRIVSKDKHRFQFDNYDLDLSYITDRVIAMCQPGQSFQRMFMNDIDKLSQFFRTYHKDHYMIYNLSETSYDYKKFDYRVKAMGFTDHHNPPLASLIRTVTDIDAYLRADESNVVAIHCRAGRGRTGTVVACYLLYSNYLSNFPADEQVFAALSLFAQRRSHNNTGVRVPSQIRYVHYFYRYLRTCPLLPPPPPPVTEIFLDKLLMLDIPRLEKNKWGGNFNPVVRISQLFDRPPHGLIFTYQPPLEAMRLLEMKAAQPASVQQNEPSVPELKELTIDLGGVRLEGDILVQVFHRATSRMAYAELLKTFVTATDMFLSGKNAPQNAGYPLVPVFRFSFHTSFVDVEKGFHLQRDQCDANYSGSLTAAPIPSSFALSLVFAGSSVLLPPPPPSSSSAPPIPPRLQMTANDANTFDPINQPQPPFSARSEGSSREFWEDPSLNGDSNPISDRGNSPHFGGWGDAPPPIIDRSTKPSASTDYSVGAHQQQHNNGSFCVGYEPNQQADPSQFHDPQH